jgi:hypothetical protein
MYRIFTLSALHVLRVHLLVLAIASQSLQAET